MSNQRFLFFFILMGYIFTPTIFNWVISPTGAWYKPYIVWMVLIASVYLLQKNNKFL